MKAILREPASREEIADSDFVVCRPSTWKIDAETQLRWLEILETDEHGRCASCHRAITFRPVALGIKKICALCFLKIAKADGETADPVYQRFKRQAIDNGEAA